MNHNDLFIRREILIFSLIPTKLFELVLQQRNLNKYVLHIQLIVIQTHTHIYIKGCRCERKAEQGIWHPIGQLSLPQGRYILLFKGEIFMKDSKVFKVLQIYRCIYYDLNFFYVDTKTQSRWYVDYLPNPNTSI